MKIKVWKLLSLILITIFAVSTVSMVHAIPTLTISSRITGLGDSIMTYDSGQHEIFVTGFDLGTNVSAISEDTNKVVASVSIPSGANGIAYDSGTNEIFVASGNYITEGDTPTITVISDNNLNIAANIASGFNAFVPWGVAYDSGQHKIYVTDAGNNGNDLGGVFIISDADNTIAGYIYVGTYPKAIVYDSGTNEIFVANAGDNTVSVITDNNNTVVANINVGNYPFGLAYDPSQGKIFVANAGDNTVSVISDNTNEVVANVTGLTGVGGIAYDSAKGEIFTGNAVISDSSNQVVAYVPVTLGSIIYDSNKGEIVGTGQTPGKTSGTYSDDIQIISDSTSTTTSPSPNTTSTPTQQFQSSTVQHSLQ